MVKAGLKAIYVSGWQVAADANLAGHTYPDQSLYPANSAPALVHRLCSALLRADQIDSAEGRNGTYWLAPDRRRCRGRVRRPAERVRADEGDDRGRRRGRPLRGSAVLGEEVRSPRRQGARPHEQFVRTLVAARLAADVLDVPTVLVARTDARRRRSSRATSTSETASSSRASAPPRASSASGRASRPRSPGARVRAVRRRPLVRDVDARSRRGCTVRRGGARAVPRQAPRLQLLAVVQLEEAPRRRDHRARSSASWRDGLQVPVRDPRGLHACATRCSTSRAATRRRA